MKAEPKRKLRIAINGIGVAGPTLAFWLKKYGFEPVLFERSTALRDGGYVIDFWGVGYGIAEKMGILPALEKHSYHVKTLRMVNDKGETLAETNTQKLTAIAGEPMMSISRSALAAEIFRACDDVETHFGTHITGIEEGDHHITALLSNGTTENFDLVIGADGLHSKIRRLAFGPHDDFEKPLGAHVAAFRLKDYSPRDELTYLTYTKPGKQIARFSLRGNETLFLFVFTSNLMTAEPQNEAEEKATLRKLFKNSAWEADKILERMDEVDDIYFDSVSQIHMDNWFKGRTALIGDAAACASLLAGEGTGLAMAEAYTLAGELHRANGEHTIAYPKYQSRLKDFLDGKQTAAAKMIGFFVPKNKFQAWFYRVAIKASSWPPIGKLLVKRTISDDITLPDYEND